MIGNYMDLDDFQTYRAVIDIDGNSWSERFPRLLCRNSVVVKIQPEQVDYFWSTLQAGVHYIATNISHLVEAVQYALDPDHEDEMQRMVANARHWCRQRMVGVRRACARRAAFANRHSHMLFLHGPTIGGTASSVRCVIDFEWICRAAVSRRPAMVSSPYQSQCRSNEI